MSLLSFEPFLRDDIYVCIYHFRIRLSQTFCISASYADLSLSKNFFSRHLSPDKTRKSHLDFPVKLHPRNNCYRYNPELVRVNKAIAPWEIYLLNQNISGKTLITSASGSIFTSLIYFGMDVNIILIYKLIKEKIPLLNSNFEHLLASISKQTQAKIFIPESYDELKSILMKLTNK